jgi:hypothetical protein
VFDLSEFVSGVMRDLPEREREFIRYVLLEMSTDRNTCILQPAVLFVSPNTSYFPTSFKPLG